MGVLKYLGFLIFLSKLAYLFDLFEKLNALNLSLQGSNTHILKLAEKVSAFRKSYYNGENK